MKDLIFGWLLKPEIQQTPLDDLIGTIEIIIVFILVVLICSYIDEKRGK